MEVGLGALSVEFQRPAAGLYREAFGVRRLAGAFGVEGRSSAKKREQALAQVNNQFSILNH